MATEENLAQWVQSMRADGVHVTPRMIQVMALEMVIDARLDESSFPASWSWFQGFKKRHKFAMRARTRTGQDTNGDGMAALASFEAHISQVMRDNNIEVVFNAEHSQL
ncbi:hypothetical protein H310_04475 [Aphanomyces invadans]|uniref:HTH CENPB-type domain-containing protein n=1 Tax=Aphanomyces invadans TaxID=157072 RepID=A0A024UD28_9STRA|nr:hypothetical protein H310_04475 [Aphanomyces invadans]ETW04115.1 hypothetical protein H310_04475 [Aphanomyces invadans]|eukprot:XP_008867071.1 hypothetical protein H310_04475 [Aphanomyces invadans]